jgi:hypothetical protein
MLPALAAVPLLEARLGLDPDSLVEGEYARARAALDDASALVRAEARQTWYDTILDTVTPPDVIVRVVLAVAQRVYTNPDSTVQETVGPFSRRISETGLGPYLTEAELALVRRYRPSDTGLWTLRTQRDEVSLGTIFYEDSFGCELLPLASDSDGVWPE